MEYRNLGNTGIRVSAIGYGGWGIGGGWGPTDDAEALRAIAAARDQGVTTFDTALGYGDGHSEELIGKALASERPAVVIASKIPPKTGRWPVLPDQPVESTFPADWIVECTEQSLRHLGTDYLDLQQLHAWTDAYTYSDEWRSAFERLRQQGKIRAYGISSNDWDPYGPVGLAESGRIQTVQVIYNVFEQRPAERLLPAALERHVGILARVPLEEGLLTGAIRPAHRFAEGDWRAEWLTPERIAAASPRLEALDALRGPEHPTLAALALHFALSHPAVSTVLVGMASARHVAENCAVADMLPLDPATLRALQSHAWVHGWVYPWLQR